jgi:hypothetical protein
MGICAVTFSDFGEQVKHMFSPQAAGNAFTARFGLGEGQEKAGYIYHTCILIHHHQAPGAHYCPSLGQRIVVYGQIQKVGWQATPRRTTSLCGLKLKVVRYASANIEYHFP